MLAEEHVHFMFTRGAWDNISCDRLAVEEVTGDRRYYNSMLMKHPYRTWKEQV